MTAPRLPRRSWFPAALRRRSSRTVRPWAPLRALVLVLGALVSLAPWWGALNPFGAALVVIGVGLSFGAALRQRGFATAVGVLAVVALAVRSAPPDVAVLAVVVLLALFLAAVQLLETGVRPGAAAPGAVAALLRTHAVSGLAGLVAAVAVLAVVDVRTSSSGVSLAVAVTAMAALFVAVTLFVRSFRTTGRPDATD